ncbi:hypothetical protein GE09DRAFT_29231 [Coniochaeta sp. 2T2.1]|nr:hypothetical protein GE09DRAFT_29231 [Coniochaeta sp. 2T2.1]
MDSCFAASSRQIPVCSGHVFYQSINQEKAVSTRCQAIQQEQQRLNERQVIATCSPQCARRSRNTIVVGWVLPRILSSCVSLNREGVHSSTQRQLPFPQVSASSMENIRTITPHSERTASVWSLAFRGILSLLPARKHVDHYSGHRGSARSNSPSRFRLSFLCPLTSISLTATRTSPPRDPSIWLRRLNSSWRRPARHSVIPSLASLGPTAWTFPAQAISILSSLFFPPTPGTKSWSLAPVALGPARCVFRRSDWWNQLSSSFDRVAIGGQAR